MSKLLCRICKETLEQSLTTCEVHNQCVHAFEQQLAEAKAEITNIKWLCDAYDEFSRPISADCELTELAERVAGIFAELQTNIDNMSTENDGVGYLQNDLKNANAEIERLKDDMLKVEADSVDLKKLLEECEKAMEPFTRHDEDIDDDELYLYEVKSGDVRKLKELLEKLKAIKSEGGEKK